MQSILLKNMKNLIQAIKDIAPVTIYLEDIFVVLSSFFVILLAVAITLAELNLFFLVNVYSISALFSFVILLLIYLVHMKKSSVVIEKRDLIIIVALLIICVINVIFFHESFAGGRDDGVYANTAL